jgi:hypothetical protein
MTRRPWMPTFEIGSQQLDPGNRLSDATAKRLDAPQT